MDREQFLMERRSGIGGSDIAAICSENPWKKPIDVYLDKIGMSADRETTDQMEIGTWMEPKIVDMLAKKTGNRMIYFAQNGHQPDSPDVVCQPQKMFRHKDHEFLMCHPDAFILGDGEPIGVVECKTAGIRQSAFYGEEDTDEMPTQYLLQMQYTMGVCASELARFLRIGHLPLILDNKFKFYKADYSPELFKSMEKIAIDFWNDHVLKLIPPEPDNSEQYATYLKSTFKDAGTEIVANEEIEVAMMTYAKIKEDLKALEEAMQFRKNQIKAFLGDNSVLRGQRFMMTWKADKPSFAINYKAICDHLHVPEDVIVTFTHQKNPIRRLLGPKAVK